MSDSYNEKRTGGEPFLDAKETVRWHERLSALLLPAMQHVVERQGVAQSGAYNFYDFRLRQRKVFLEYELALAQKLLSCELEIEHVHEVGSGFGQLVFLLGWNGFKAAGFELDQPRAKTGEALRSVLTLIEPELMRNITLHRHGFPSDSVPVPSRSLVLTTNFAVTSTPEAQMAIVKGMRRYRYVLIDVQRFFGLRMEIEREHEVLSLFARAGFEAPTLFLDLGPSGKYYLFEGGVEGSGQHSYTERRPGAFRHIFRAFRLPLGSGVRHLMQSFKKGGPAGRR